jgi:hypothetical protein
MAHLRHGRRRRRATLTVAPRCTWACLADPTHTERRGDRARRRCLRVMKPPAWCNLATSGASASGMAESDDVLQDSDDRRDRARAGAVPVRPQARIPSPSAHHARDRSQRDAPGSERRGCACAISLIAFAALEAMLASGPQGRRSPDVACASMPCSAGGPSNVRRGEMSARQRTQGTKWKYSDCGGQGAQYWCKRW